MEGVFAGIDRIGAIIYGDGVVAFDRVFFGGNVIGSARQRQIIVAGNTVFGRFNVQCPAAVDRKIALGEDDGVVFLVVIRKVAGNFQRIR